VLLIVAGAGYVWYSIASLSPPTTRARAAPRPIAAPASVADRARDTAPAARNSMRLSRSRNAQGSSGTAAPLRAA
jgi:hypothetical protein